MTSCLFLFSETLLEINIVMLLYSSEKKRFIIVIVRSLDTDVPRKLGVLSVEHLIRSNRPAYCCTNTKNDWALAAEKCNLLLFLLERTRVLYDLLPFL